MPVHESLEYTSCVVGRRGPGQDRCRVVADGSALIIALADGAGGSAGGAEAAEAIVDSIQSHRVQTRAACETLLGVLDLEMLRAPLVGEATAVIVRLSEGRIEGASVGDSVALLVGGGEIRDLSSAQHRKPLMGSGEVTPVGFSAALEHQTLILGTDGLHKYWNPDDAHEALASADLAASALRLVDSVRLRSGELQDDVGIALVRARRLCGS